MIYSNLSRSFKAAVAATALALGAFEGFAARNDAPNRARQSPPYRRVVVDERARPLDYFNVVVATLPDSTYVSGETFTNGRLELPADIDGRKLIRISSLGYDDLAYEEDFASPATPDTIVMRAAAVAMDAVTVAARVPVVSTSQGKSVVRVAGSSLQHLPEVTDILRRAPGMSVDEGGLTVFGKGTPQIYIDGRETTYAELQLLQPQQILTIEVDRNPSARYDASYASVVRVRTTRRREGISGQVTNQSRLGRRYTDAASAQLQIAGKRWVNYFSYRYVNQTQHNYSTDTEAIHLSASPISDTVLSNTVNRARAHSLLYGSTLDITPRHQLSWQYSGYFSDWRYDDNQTERLRRSGELENIAAHVAGSDRGTSHSANARYRFAVDSVRTLEVTADYARSTPRGRSTVDYSGTRDMITIGNRSAADVFSAKAEYETPLWGADLLVGLHYGLIDSRTTSVYNDDATVTLLASDNAAAYATLGKEYAKWGWSAGLRGEFLNDDIRVGGQTLRKGWENNLFPSLEFYTSELSKAVDLSLSYTSRIERPSVSMLDPSADYVNSVVTGYGNPLLRSTISHNLEFGMTLWSNLSLTFGANFDINPSISSGELAEDGQSIAFKPLNIARSRKWLVGATYNNSWGPLSLTVDGAVEFPHAKIPYLGETISVGRPSWYASANADLKIAANTAMTAGFDYYGRGYALMTVMEPANNLTFGVTQYLFDRRLQLSLSGHDLLRGGVGSGGKGWRDRYGFYETSQRSNRDSRYVRLSVRWLFNNHKARYSERGDSEERSRVN